MVHVDIRESNETKVIAQGSQYDYINNVGPNLCLELGVGNIAPDGSFKL